MQTIDLQHIKHTIPTPNHAADQSKSSYILQNKLLKKEKPLLNKQGQWKNKPKIKIAKTSKTKPLAAL